MSSSSHSVGFLRWALGRFRLAGALFCLALCPAAFATVSLSSYTFLISQPPQISSDALIGNTYMGSAAYRLEAKFIGSGYPSGFTAALSFQNNGKVLDSLPAPGTYTVELRETQIVGLQSGYSIYPGPSRTVTVTVLPAGVWLSTYSMVTTQRPTISTWDEMPSSENGKYRLRAKLIDGSPLAFHAAYSVGNNGRPLDELPPTGTYPAALYWVKYDTTGNIIHEIGPEIVRTVSVANSQVALSSYWFHQAARASISSPVVVPAPYRLAAQLLYGNGTAYEAATAMDNNGRRLDALPAAGTYTVRLFLQRFENGGTAVTDVGTLRTDTVTITDGPLPLLNESGQLYAYDSFDENENYDGTNVSTDYFDFNVPAAGRLGVSVSGARGAIYGPTWDYVGEASAEGLIDVAAGFYRVIVSSDTGGLSAADWTGGAYQISAGLLPNNPPPTISVAAIPPLTLGHPFSYQIVASESPTSYTATSLPPGLTVNANTGLITGTPTQVGNFSPVFYASNAGGQGPSVRPDFNVNAPPGKPQYLSAQATSSTAIALYWAAPAGNPSAALYEVEVNNVSRGTTTATLMVLTGLAPATIYNSKVRAISAAGLTSQWSNDALVGTAPTGTPGGGASVWMPMPGVVRDPANNQVISPYGYDGVLDEILPAGAGGITSFKWVDYSPSYTITAGGYDDPYDPNDFWIWANSFANSNNQPISSPQFQMPFLYFNLSGLTARLEMNFDVKDGESYQVFEDSTGSTLLNPGNLAKVGEVFPSQSTGSHHILSATYELFSAMHPKFYVVRYGVAPKTITASLAPGVVLSTAVTGGGITLDLPNDLKAIIGTDSVTVASANGGPWIKASPTGVSVGGLPVGDATIGVGPTGGSVELANGVKIAVNGGAVSITGLAGVNTLPAGTTETLADGTVLAADAQGNTTTTLPGGTVVRIGANGGGSVTLAGGATVVVDKNGTVGAGLRLPDGTELVVDSTGRASATLPSGVGVSVGAGGKINLKLPANVPPIIAKVVSVANKVLTGESIWVIRDIFGTGGILPLPAGATNVLGEADISLAAAGGLYEVGLRIRADGPIQWFTVTPSIKLMVDANRDGTIADGETSTAAAPYRFWINDDDDAGETNGNDIPAPSNSSNGAATTNFDGDGVVNGSRDLVDFFPVFLDIKQLLTVLPHTSPGVKYKLKHADGALNFVYTKLSRADALKYQTEDRGAIFGPALNQPAASAGTRRISAVGVELSAPFLTGVKDQDWGVILVEGWLPTTKPLVLSVEKDGAMIAEVKLELNITPVEDLYRRINLRDGVRDGADAPAGLAGDLAVRNNDLGKPTSLGEPPAYPDSLTNGKWFVFVVGSNVGGAKMRGWQSEVFKRMHWSGSKARFVGVSWYGDPYSDGNDAVYDYHSAARNAFTTAPALTAKLNTLSGSKTIAGHSAAALIISSAIADHGLTVSNACLIDAAMARETFDGAAADDVANMVPALWRDYPPEFWASRWHERFPATDARSKLTWRDRFTGAASVVHNFYSSTEDVLAAYPGTVNGSIIENVRAPGSFAWVVQEKAKGDKLRIGWFIHAGSDYGGWGYNLTDPLLNGDPKWYFPFANQVGTPSRRVKTPAEVGSAAGYGDALRRAPFFKTGWGRWNQNQPDQEIIDTNYFDGPSWVYDLYRSTTGHAIAADPIKRSQLLNEAIPALSLAVGANPLAFSSIPSTRQYNMPAQFADAARWPSIRGVNNTSGVAVPVWHHSDMREVAYLYLSRFYDKLSSLANQ